MRSTLRKKTPQVVLRLVLRLALPELGTPGGHDVPATAARGQRVRGDDRDVGSNQVVPPRDGLRVAGADDHDDDRVGDHPVVVVLVPGGLQDTRLNQLDVVALVGQRHQVGRHSRLEGAALLAGTAKRALDLDAPAGLGLLKHGNELGARLLHRRVRRQVQCHTGLRRRRLAAVRQHRRQQRRQENGAAAPEALIIAILAFSRIRLLLPTSVTGGPGNLPGRCPRGGFGRLAGRRTSTCQMFVLTRC